MTTVVKDRQGLVLLLVLSAVALFMALVIPFTADQFTDLELAANFKDSLQCQYLGNGGVEAAVSILSEDNRAYDADDEDWAKFSEALLLSSSYLDGMRMTGEISDECAKLNINALVRLQGGQWVADPFRIEQFKKLFTVLEIEISETELRDLCDALVDWLDGDDEITGTGGAESEYYQSLEQPYQAKNRPMDTPEEILLVKGMHENKQWFYGTFNEDGSVDVKGIKDYITCGPLDMKVNLNTASPEVLQCLSKDIDASMAESFIDCRPIKTDNDMETCKAGFNTIADYEQLRRMTDIKSSRFSVTVTGGMPSGSALNVRAILDVNKKPQIVYYRMY
ncbi:MAG TPA: type II secretion system minor pseudopilin GspK [Deltaproteobacteria bacterium]|nr:type II secretion system minor pseudopilin GspK [Deltaproteobacteria bacterium]